VTHLQDEIARVQASEAAETVIRAAAHGPQALTLVGPAAGLAVMGAIVRWVGALEEENKRYLRELKAIVRDGLLVFEELGPDAVRLGGDRLLERLRAIPVLLESYYAGLEPHARAVEGLLEPIVV
jgi:hypothetical protein